MELNFNKCPKYPKNYAIELTTVMDHDSGYVDSVVDEVTRSSLSNDPKKQLYRDPENFLLSEDALLEKPDGVLKQSDNFPPSSISPEEIPDSIEMEDNYCLDGLMGSSSAEISIQSEITVSAASLSDDESLLVHNAGKSNFSCSFNTTKTDVAPLCEAFKISQCESEKTNTHTSSNRRLTLVFSKINSDNEYCVKRKYPSLTPQKNVTTSANSSFEIDSEHPYCDLSAAKNVPASETSSFQIDVTRKDPSLTPDKKLTVAPNSYISPDIFDDDEIVENKPTYFEIMARDNMLSSQTKSEKYVDRLDEKLLKRTQRGLSGVLPPPSVTLVHLTAQEILAKYLENRSYAFWNNESTGQEAKDEPDKNVSLNASGSNEKKTVLLSVTLEEVKKTKFPQVLDMRCHGLHYNCGTVSEEIVDLCDKYQKRYVGAETQSTCTVFETAHPISPSKQKFSRPKLSAKSPGRRLSHLARRRITFGNSSTQAGGTLLGSRARQILVDARKIDLLNKRKSPRKTPRKTPNKSPKKTRTPSSSAKKKLAMRFRKMAGELEKSAPSTSRPFSTQRNLFKSPERGIKSENAKGILKNTKRSLFQSPSRSNYSSLISNRSPKAQKSVEKSSLRRALFASPKKPSPLKRSPTKSFLLKRKRSDCEDDHEPPPTKFARSVSVNALPSSSGLTKSLSKTQSELNVSLTKPQLKLEYEQQRRKLLWAVSDALKTQDVARDHPHFKVFASVLGRVTRELFLEQTAALKRLGAKPESGTSERMLRIARNHVIAVTKGQTADEIVKEYRRSRMKVPKVQGYVPPPGDYDTAPAKIKETSDGKENVFQDRANTIESWEKRKLEQLNKPNIMNNRLERIKKVINFNDDR